MARLQNPANPPSFGHIWRSCHRVTAVLRRLQSTGGWLEIGPTQSQFHRPYQALLDGFWTRGRIESQRRC